MNWVTWCDNISSSKFLFFPAALHLCPAVGMPGKRWLLCDPLSIVTRSYFILNRRYLIIWLDCCRVGHFNCRSKFANLGRFKQHLETKHAVCSWKLPYSYPWVEICCLHTVNAFFAGLCKVQCTIGQHPADLVTARYCKPFHLSPHILNRLGCYGLQLSRLTLDSVSYLLSALCWLVGFVSLQLIARCRITSITQNFTS